MKTLNPILLRTLALAGFVLLLASASPAKAVDTLDVKVTMTGQWTTFAFSVSDTLLRDASRVPCVARDGSIWWGLDKSAVRYDGTTWTRYTSKDGLMEGKVLSIVQGEDGTLWFSGSHQGKAAVTRYDGRTWQIYSGQEGLDGVGERFDDERRGSASVIDQRGNLWINTSDVHRDGGAPYGDRTKGGNGVLQFDGKTWRNFRVEDGLAHNRVYDIAADPDGPVWFATLGGVSRFDGQNWTTYTRKDGLGHSKSVRIIVAQDGKVWVCTAIDILSPPGVSVFDGRTWKFYSESNGLLVRSVEAVYQTDDGAIWFGASGEGFVRFGTRGLLRYQDGAWLRILQKDGLPGDIVHSITQSRDGSLWLTVPKVGLVRYRPDFTDLGTISGTLKHSDASPLAGVAIRVEDKAGEARSGTMAGVDGHYRVRVFPDTYQVSVIPGLIPRRGGQPVELISPQEVQPLEVVVEEGGQVQEMEADLVVTPIELPEELQRAAAAYQTLRGYRDTTIVEIHMVQSGSDNRITTPVLFAFERPNRVRLEIKATPMMGGTMRRVSDGKMLVTYLGRLNQYMKKEAPENLTSADMWSPGGPVRGMIVQKIMVEDDPLNELIKGVVEVKEMGNENLGGIPVTVLELTTRRVGSLLRFPWVGSCGVDG